MTTTPWDFGIQKELRMVEQKLHDVVGSEEPVLTEASLHVIDAGGKRIRPAVTILTYKSLGGQDIEKIVNVATGIELIHSATLVHDDINDGGYTRRGRETVFKKYGLHDAIVTGDFLFVKAFQLAGMFDKSIIDTTADACSKLAEGEILQNRYRHHTDLTVDTYLKIIERKTGYFLRAGATVAGILAKAEADVVQSVGSYGSDLGIAFQIIDDVLDFTGDPEVVGKQLGVDLREGHLTIPSLLAMKESEATKKAILQVVREENPSPESIKGGVEVVVKSGAIEKARGMAEYYGVEAIGHIGCLGRSSESQALRDLVKRVLERKS
ncbi:MAG TPA: polyprenyl synthetase family protein [Thermoplasmata archaeon]